MNVLVTGALGQLGRDVVREVNRRGYICTAADFRAAGSEAETSSRTRFVHLDITDREAVDGIIRETQPDAVIHCAAWTDVEESEKAENRSRVDAVNRLGTQYVAKAVKAVDAKMIYISTDYVFDGQGDSPWEPDGRRFGPLNVYGQSKLDGERAAASVLDKYFIVRISWAFGSGGKNFVKTMLRAGRNHDRVRVVSDQIGAPTYTVDLARLLADMMETERYGCYHATNSGGYISWYDYCCEIYRQAGLRTEVIPVTTEEYGLSRARRPLNSRLDTSKLARAGFSLLPPWQDALSRYLKGIDDGTDVD